MCAEIGADHADVCPHLSRQFESSPSSPDSVLRPPPTPRKKQAVSLDGGSGNSQDEGLVNTRTPPFELRMKPRVNSCSLISVSRGKQYGGIICKHRDVYKEKRRQQDEEDRVRREMEDEKLRLQQLKRKSLRDQWLMEGAPLSPTSLDAQSPRSPLWGPQAQEIEKHIDKLQSEIDDEQVEILSRQNEEQMIDVLAVLWWNENEIKRHSLVFCNRQGHRAHSWQHRLAGSLTWTTSLRCLLALLRRVVFPDPLVAQQKLHTSPNISRYMEHAPEVCSLHLPFKPDQSISILRNY
ncbi:paralemmin-3 isoform X3 [Lates japonicus]|uniref:Paralemmin-3 isoform X3 n=1 Tax=Lates japonicus TaxID=270547 RepID=A0AAD3MJ20_LATJO|nr:paralemmin-3 isoform X3 [Lates japonicus]